MGYVYLLATPKPPHTVHHHQLSPKKIMVRVDQTLHLLTKSEVVIVRIIRRTVTTQTSVQPHMCVVGFTQQNHIG